LEEHPSVSFPLERRIPSVSPLEKREDPFHILPLRKKERITSPKSSPSLREGED